MLPRSHLHMRYDQGYHIGNSTRSLYLYKRHTPQEWQGNHSRTTKREIIIMLIVENIESQKTLFQ